MVKGQTQVVVFVLLFLITLLLVFSSVFWGRDVSEKNVDIGRITASESFINRLDSSIQNVARYGGTQIIDYNLNAVVGIKDVGYDDYVELSTPVSLDLPKYWINTTDPSKIGSIREKEENGMLKIQLFYPVKEESGFAIDLYTDGPQTGQPAQIKIEKVSSEDEMIEGKEYRVAKVKITIVL